MRLIDADDLHVYVMGGRCSGKITAKTLVEEALERIFREAPTVEAIPIEWIEEYMDKLDSNISKYTINSMVHQWKAVRKEG